MDPIELPHGELPPPMLPPSSEITWLPRRRRRTPRHQRQPWTDPRIANIIQRMAPAFVVGQVASASGSAGTLTVTLPSNVTPGNCIILDVASLSTASFTLPTDTLSNLYVVAAAQTNTGNCKLANYFANNSPGGACTISFVVPSAATTITVREYSGVGSVAGNRTIVDSTSGNIASGATPSATVTPQQSGSLLLGAVCDATGGLTWTAGGALTNRRSSVTATMDLAVADAVLSSTSVGNATASWTNGGTTTQYIAVAIVLRPAGTQAVASTTTVGTASASSLTTGSIGPKLGEVLIASVDLAHSAGPCTGVIDSSGLNTWAKIDAEDNASGVELSLWRCTNASPSALTVTAAFTGTGQASMNVFALPGIISNASLVDTITKATGNGTSVSVGPSATTAIPGETALLFVATPGTSTFTNGGSTSLIQALNSSRGSQGIETLLLNATGTQTMTATLGTSSQWSAILITLKTGGVSLVQSQTNGFASGATGANVGGAFTFNTAPGNLMLAAIGNGNGKSITGITDNQSVAWSVVPNAPSNGNTRVVQFYRQNIVGGTLNTFNVTFAGGGTTAARFIAVELSGMATSSAYDVQGTFTGTSASPSATTPTPNSLLEIGFAAITDGTTGTAFTPTSPAVSPQASVTTTMDLGIGLLASFQPGVVPSGISMGFTNTSAAVAAAVATFKIAGSGAYYNETLPETLSTSDVLSRTFAFYRTLADTFSTSDTVAAQWAYRRTLAEVLTTTDAASIQAVYARNLAETLATADALSTHLDTLRSLSESLTTSDAVTVTLGRQAVLGDTVGTTDAVLASRAYARLLADTDAVVDTLTSRLDITREEAETLATTDAAVGSRGQSRTIEDTLSTIDIMGLDIHRSAPMDFTVSLAENGTTTDLVTHVPDFLVAQIVESVLTADAVGVHAARQRVLTEILNTRDILAAVVRRQSAALTAIPVGTGSTGRGILNSDVELVQTMGDGTKIAVFDTAEGVGHYAVSRDNGRSWQARGVTPSPLCAGTPFSLSGDGTMLTMFRYQFGQVEQDDFVYTPGTATLSGPTTTTWTLPNGGGTALAAAYYDGTRWYLAALAAIASRNVLALGTETAPGRVRWQTAPLGVGFADSVDLIVGNGGTTYVSVADSGLQKLQVFALEFDPTALTFAMPAVMRPETAWTYPNGFSVGRHDMALEPSGTLTLLWQWNGTMYSVRRTGVGSYGSVQTLGANVLGQQYAWGYAESTDTLWVTWADATQDPTGPVLMAAKRQSGAWGAAAAVPTALHTHAQAPGADQNGELSFDILYQTPPPEGNPFGGTVYFLGIPAAVAPQLPANLTPTGVVGDSEPPVFGWLYVNFSPNNPQGSFQVQTRVAGGTTVTWDSGVVPGDAASVAYAGPALVDGVPMEWRVQVFDSLTNGGAGTTSGYTTWQAFTVVSAPAVEVTAVEVTTGTTSSFPVTLEGPRVGAVFTVTQSQAHATGSYRLEVLADDATAVVWSSPAMTLDPVVASGGEVTTPLFDVTGLEDGGTYYLRATAVDDVTGVEGVSSEIELDATYTGPSAPEDVVLTPNPGVSRNVVTWTLPDVATTDVTVTRVPVDTTIPPTVIASGTLLTALEDPAPILQPVTYSVQAFNAEGNASSPTSSNAAALGLYQNKLGIVITSDLDPSIQAWFGAIEDWTTTGWDLQDDANVYTGLGATLPTTLFGRTNYWTTAGGQQMKLFVPFTDFGPDGEIDGHATFRQAYLLASRHGKVRYRDPLGTERHAVMRQFHYEIVNAVGYYIEFALTQAPDPLTPVVVLP